MARFKGPIQFTGSLGNLRSYWDEDTQQQIISLKRGKNPDNYQNDTVDELNQEFKAVNIWAKLIRESTLDLVYLKKGRLNGKLVKIAKQIQTLDPQGGLGFRKIESSKLNAPLVGFCMNNSHPFKEVCNIDPAIEISKDRNEVTFSMPNFVSFGKFKWDVQVKYFRIYILIYELPDIEWNATNREYSPVYSSESLGSKTVVSEWKQVITQPVNIVIPVAFDDNHLPKEKSTVMVSVGFEFASNMLYDTPYVVKDNGTCAILGCF